MPRTQQRTNTHRRQREHIHKEVDRVHINTEDNRTFAHKKTAENVHTKGYRKHIQLEDIREQIYTADRTFTENTFTWKTEIVHTDNSRDQNHTKIENR